ncbi:hypothetical protein IQ285_10085 [Burkholderia sp. R-69608]|uniref:hypothetical protein n=1 Tax=Paraburkholderia nemoris TaxID=2793076 RepID=UPI0019128240|nr:hypothetical protein [Paraburkholderia nemoris]MBK5148029.1 hypothetical protein [Burkholderia sp. R-69608]
MAQVRQMLEQGQAVKDIARALDMDCQAIYSAKYRMKRAGAVVATAVEFDVDVAGERATPQTPAPMPVCLSRLPEPQRVFVIDWQRRMSAYEYTVPPDGCLPKKRPKRISGMTHGQLREEMRGHTRVLPSAINCAAPAAGFAGEKVFNVEQAWEAACTQ